MKDIQSYTLSFQKYEIENILKVLEKSLYDIHIRREIFWGTLKNSNHTKIKKQLNFTIKSIKRQQSRNSLEWVKIKGKQ